MKISRVKEMRELDGRAVKEYGVKEEILMENAGLAATSVIMQEVGIQDKNFVIICGSGNNGGDGLVVARKLISNGGNVTVYMPGNPKKFKGAAKFNYDIAKKLKIKILSLNDPKKIKSKLDDYDLIIDAVFGTGLDRDVEGKYNDAIEIMNNAGKPVMSLDIPSGINGNNGQVLGTAVRADYTVTFGLPKLGNLLYPGYDYNGKLFVTHISFPPELHDGKHLKIAVNDPLPLPKRQSDGHKGTFGKVLFVAGSSNYLGAPYFAAQSFLMAGGGLSYLATPDTVSRFIGNKGSEIVFVPQIPTETGSISLKNLDALLEITGDVDLVVIGPGLSTNKETQQLIRDLCAEITKPVLIDGDGITAISGFQDSIKARSAETIVTPHPGEMARLTAMKISEIQSKPVEVVQATAKALNATVVLKGAHTLIAHKDKSTLINLSGNPGMATAGSGDVLTGAIAAMYGIGFDLRQAVNMGVFVHGLAGDLAAKEVGTDGMVAGDIMRMLPAAMQLLRSDFGRLARDSYGKIFVV